jgi:hypothetical protein
MKKIVKDALIGASMLGATAVVWYAVVNVFCVLSVWGVK